MIFKYLPLLILFFFSTLSQSIFAENIPKRLTFCIDRTYWYPFTFTIDHKPSGLYVDMINDAMDRMSRKVSIRPMDWERCIKRVKKGTIDGILGIHYNDHHNSFLSFPANAGHTKESKGHISLVEYVVVTGTENDFIYRGSPKTIPQPVRVPRSYSIGHDLIKAGLEVNNHQFNTDQGTALRLSNVQTGSAVMLRSVAEYFESHPIFNGKIKTQEIPFMKKPAFVAFSREADLPKSLQQDIWNVLDLIRSDSVTMAEYVENYKSVNVEDFISPYSE